MKNFENMELSKFQLNEIKGGSGRYVSSGNNDSGLRKNSSQPGDGDIVVGTHDEDEQVCVEDYESPC